jgi:hypothetical protein
MTTTEADELLKEARDLLFIPNIGRALEHKILELKEAIARNIGSYQITEAPKEQRRHSLKGIGFRINRIGKNLWIPSIPENPKTDVYQVIPQPIVDYIVKTDIDTGVINMQSGLKFPALKGRVFNLSFEKHNYHFITGIINEVKADNGLLSAENQAAAIDPLLHGETPKKAEVIKLIVYYLANFDPFYNHVASEFFLHWKQLIDHQLLARVNAK